MAVCCSSGDTMVTLLPESERACSSARRSCSSAGYLDRTDASISAAFAAASASTSTACAFSLEASSSACAALMRILFSCSCSTRRAMASSSALDCAMAVFCLMTACSALAVAATSDWRAISRAISSSRTLASSTLNRTSSRPHSDRCVRSSSRTMSTTWSCAFSSSADAADCPSTRSRLASILFRDALRKLPLVVCCTARTMSETHRFSTWGMMSARRSFLRTRCESFTWNATSSFMPILSESRVVMGS
mmetsp:Transcript_16875/g.52416  ORF Transcript_16875/g.52416 Transcript_16875/m.52416 type:complete len:249 (-) Transcript_16875:1176-1922(-)